MSVSHILLPDHSFRNNYCYQQSQVVWCKIIWYTVSNVVLNSIRLVFSSSIIDQLLHRFGCGNSCIRDRGVKINSRTCSANVGSLNARYRRVFRRSGATNDFLALGCFALGLANEANQYVYLCDINPGDN